VHELVDVVDEQDRVERTLPRDEVHAQGLLHRCVHVFVFDAHGRLWLQKRALDLRLYAGKWTSSASGHVDAGEDYLTAARREVDEELGIKVEPRKVAMFRFHDGEENELSALCEARSEARPEPHPEEVLAVVRMGAQELEATMERLPGSFAPSFVAAWGAWKRLRG
jgi:16S rRNA (adenine1518-N6/adenine1519-N6)-dimethyltransferase